MGQKIPVILRVDVEPNGLFIDPRNPLPWTGYEHTYDFFQSLRSQLFSMSGSPVHFSWMFRMDPQITQTYGTPVWAVEHYEPSVRACEAAGDDIGLHIHAYRWVPEHEAWMADFGDPVWVDHCIRTAVHAYRSFFKRDCRVTSLGDRWISNTALALLERCGVQYDLTVEPGHKQIPTYYPDQLYSGALPSYVGVPTAPYRPSHTDFRVPDPTRSNGLWIVPVSTGRSPYGSLGLLYRRLRHPRHHKGMARSLNLMHWPTTFSSIMNHLLATLERPYLSIVVRTDVFLKNRYLKNVRQNLSALQQHPRAKDFIVTTAEEALALLGYNKSSRTFANHDRCDPLLNA